jgi:membrane protein DedA with SNARE-associated domain
VTTPDPTGLFPYFPYLGILAAAAIEGEVVYVTAVVAASLGRLHPFGVLLSGAIGGWAGDQIWFYAAKGRLRSWLDRFENVARRRQLIQKRVQRHATKLILAVRFLPGLRIAIPLACAYSGVPAPYFSGLSFISALAWAGAIMLAIFSIGTTIGIKAWWTPVIPAVIVVIFFRWLARAGGDSE